MVTGPTREVCFLDSDNVHRTRNSLSWLAQGAPTICTSLATCTNHLIDILQVASPRKVNTTIVAHFRSVAEKIGKDDNTSARHDFENAILFLRSQREHKVA